MAKIRLTKEFAFEMAHALDGYDGACREIHGHSYRLFVTVRGCPVTDAQSPVRGMVVDFGVLKRLVHTAIVDRFDHAFVMRRSATGDRLCSLLGERFSRIVQVDYQPTCENLLTDFAASLRAVLPAEVELYALRLHETATSYAEWYADDNAAEAIS